MLTKHNDAKLASADQLRINHQQEASTIARQVETALYKRDRAQEIAAALESSVQAFKERISYVEDQIYHITTSKKKLETELHEARFDATRASSKSWKMVQMAIDASGLQEQPSHQGEKASGH